MLFFQRISYRFLGYALVVILTITGHLGGNLTHGKDHLTEPLPDEIKKRLWDWKSPPEHWFFCPKPIKNYPSILG